MSVYATSDGTRFHTATCRRISGSKTIEKVTAKEIERRELTSCKVCGAEAPKSKTATVRKKNTHHYDDINDDIDALGTELMNKLSVTGRPSNDRFFSDVEVQSFPRPVQKPDCLQAEYNGKKTLEQEFKAHGIITEYKKCEKWVNSFTGNRRGLTDEQMIAIRAYTGDHIYSVVNRALYTENTKGWETTIHCIYTGLRKLCVAKKVKKSVSSRVYRGIEKLADVKVGYSIQMKGFNSSSKSEDVARNFAKNGTLFRVLSWRVGAKIEFLSVYPTEKEVLIEPYANFKVKAITKEDGLTFVDLEHINN